MAFYYSNKVTLLELPQQSNSLTTVFVYFQLCSYHTSKNPMLMAVVHFCQFGYGRFLVLAGCLSNTEAGACFHLIKEIFLLVLDFIKQSTSTKLALSVPVSPNAAYSPMEVQEFGCSDTSNG
ncbi:neuronal membrane glycoprotein M6-b [Platysternon megacephalum]|uniref:Neuronal membrane glycoprotein M6-b n=1 Tax=Platysternon megacephalum TaxID=55544 RepID=A0A4D9EXY7_9SAUR|nr:neuronal membrane glycoprotein M6-b [Platysternon megacephalum]